jgi:hypothetical protein
MAAASSTTNVAAAETGPGFEVATARGHAPTPSGGQEHALYASVQH